MAQAQGKYTKAKIEGFAAALQQNVSVVCHGIRAQRYFHFDLNAGCGRNEIAMCDGSPIAFRAAACKAKMPQALSFCCERDEVAAKRLAERCRIDPCTLVINGRNQDVVEQIPYIIREYGGDPKTAFGSILLDPNDHNRDAIPYDELRVISKKCPRLDVFFNFPQLAIKRVNGSVAKGRHSPEVARDCVDIDDLPEVIGKEHLWIAPQIGNFVLVVGRNTDNVNDDRNTGLHRWTSEHGVWFRERCRMAVEEADKRHRERLSVASGQKLLFV